VSVEVAMAFGCGVMGLGRLKLTSLGAVVCHEAAKVTGELKPSCEMTAIMEDPVDPWMIVITLGPGATVKSGVSV
jgi:hypothetical protein